MSNALFNKVIARRGLTYQEKTTLLHLAYVSGDDCQAHISISVLAERAGCTERTAQRNIHRMVRLGVLVPIGQGGGRNIQAYRIAVDELPMIEKKKPIRRARKIVNAEVAHQADDWKPEPFPEKEIGESEAAYQQRIQEFYAPAPV